MQGRDNPRDDQKPTPLQDLSAALIRSEAAFKMFRDFSVCGLRELVSTSIQGLMDSSKIRAMDLYDRPWEEVEALLTQLNREQQWNIEYTTRKEEKACSPENFRNTLWTIDRGEKVTFLLYGDRVVGIRRGIQQSPNPDNPNQ